MSWIRLTLYEEDWTMLVQLPAFSTLRRLYNFTRPGQQIWRHAILSTTNGERARASTPTAPLIVYYVIRTRWMEAMHCREVSGNLEFLESIIRNITSYSWFMSWERVLSTRIVTYVIYSERPRARDYTHTTQRDVPIIYLLLVFNLLYCLQTIRIFSL